MSKIALILILLCSFSSYSNELPTSLFGIELDQPAENYLIDRKEFDEENKKAEEGDGYRSVCNTNEHLSTLAGKPWKRDEKIQIDLIANTTFHRQCFSWDEHNIITSISASIGHDFEKNFQKSPLSLLGGNFPNQIDLKEFINFKTELETSIAKLYKIKISDFKHLYDVVETKGKSYNKILTYFSYLVYSKNNKDYLFTSSINLMVLKEGGGSVYLNLNLKYKESDFEKNLKKQMEKTNLTSDSKKFDEIIEIIYDSNLVGF